MTYQTRLHKEAVVFHIRKIFNTEQLKIILAHIEQSTDKWCGAAVCMPIFKINIGTRQDVEIEGFINNRDKLISYDAIAASDLMLVSDVDLIQHKFRYAPGEKIRRKTKKKKENNKPATRKESSAVGNITIQNRIFTSPEFQSEINELFDLLKGFPSNKIKRSENREYLKREVVYQFETRFPTISNFDNAACNVISEMFQIMLDESLYHRMHYSLYQLSDAFISGDPDKIFDRNESMKERARIWRCKIENGWLSPEDLIFD